MACRDRFNAVRREPLARTLPVEGELLKDIVALDLAGRASYP